ncbi:hypothetical protein BGS_0588 [Beggiatoa sp. SS]|nr:hypothetical protein BGS_0588 [Beggiatoa sp. SS]
MASAQANTPPTLAVFDLLLLFVGMAVGLFNLIETNELRGENELKFLFFEFI